MIDGRREGGKQTFGSLACLYTANYPKHTLKQDDNPTFIISIAVMINPKYTIGRMQMILTNSPSNHEPCRALNAFPACSGAKHFMYTQPCTETYNGDASWRLTSGAFIEAN